MPAATSKEKIKSFFFLTSALQLSTSFPSADISTTFFPSSRWRWHILPENARKVHLHFLYCYKKRQQLWWWHRVLKCCCSEGRTTGGTLKAAEERQTHGWNFQKQRCTQEHKYLCCGCISLLITDITSTGVFVQIVKQLSATFNIYKILQIIWTIIP